MKSLNALIQFLIILMVSSTFAQAKDPTWAVKIVKRSGNSQITGTGYIVEIDGRYFVKTASHVALGTTDALELFDNRGNKLNFDSRDYITNNDLDDMMIELPGSRYEPLGKWDSSSRRFLVDSDTYKKANRHKKKNTIEIDPHFGREHSTQYITTSWINKKKSKNEYDFQMLGTSLGGTKGVHTLYDETNGYKKTQIKEIGIADFKVTGGESGSPLFGFAEDSSTPYIKGHVLSYHRTLRSSKFLDSSAFEGSINLYSKGYRGNINETVWKYENGLTFRTDNIADETSFKEIASGNGSGVDGGNGSGVDGGNGSGVDGGNGSGVDGGDTGSNDILNMGMVMGGDQVLMFSAREDIHCEHNSEINDFLKSNAHISANWLNYRFIKNLEEKAGAELYTPVEISKLGKNLYNRLVVKQQISKKLPEYYSTKNDNQSKIMKFSFHNMYQQYCLIDAAALLNNKLNMNILLYIDDGLVDHVIEQDLNDINLLESLHIKKNHKVDFDLTKLFGADPSATKAKDKMIGKSFIGITAREDGMAANDLKCFLNK